MSGNYDWTIRGIDIVNQLIWETVEEGRDYFAAVVMYTCTCRCLNGDHFTRRSQYEVIVANLNLEHTLNTKSIIKLKTTFECHWGECIARY